MIVKCSHCQQILSNDKFNSHECDLPLKEVKRINVVYFQDGSYGKKKIMTAWGIDGTLYTFEVVPRKPLPYILPLADAFLQRKRTDEELTEPFPTIYKGGIVFSEHQSFFLRLN